MIKDINLLMNILRTIIIGATCLKVVTAFLKCQTGETTVPNAVIKAKKMIQAGIVACVLPSFLPVLANTYFNPTSVIDISQGANGATLLINAIMKVIISLEPMVTVALAMKELILYKVEPEEYSKAEQLKKARTVIIIGIVIMTASSTISVILGYYT